jgi:hypothetical protein
LVRVGLRIDVACSGQARAELLTHSALVAQTGQSTRLAAEHEAIGLARGFIHSLGYCSATRGSEGDGNSNCAGVDCHSIPARAR